jgi:hypothetical protein
MISTGILSNGGFQIVRNAQKWNRGVKPTDYLIDFQKIYKSSLGHGLIPFHMLCLNEYMKD